MPRRSITDEEIGLIKAMLRRKMRNRDIQFYFNRQDRPVNSGRITGIKNGSYGPEVSAATEAELDKFLASFSPANVGVVISQNSSEPSLADLARAKFEKRKGGKWHLSDGETSAQECKETFVPKKLAPVIRAIAALANNSGGFIFFGVKDQDCQVCGLSDDLFQTTDIAFITDKIKTFLTPTPSIAKTTLDLDGIAVGVIWVEKHDHRPVIICRDGDGLDDGTILFRYPGQSARIKFGDLQAILRERDRTAHEMLLSSASRLSQIGTDSALILDTREAAVDVGDTTITIDKELAAQLEFIREGHFEENDGAPALRLIGDVRTIDSEGRTRERIEGRALTPEMVVRSFLRHQRVQFPIEYVRLSAFVQRQWLPLFYFISLSDLDVADAIKLLENTQATYQPSKAKALDRLKGNLRAFVPLRGQALPVGQALQNGEFDGLDKRYSGMLVARAVQGLPDNYSELPTIYEILDDLHEQSSDDTPLRSAVYRAASRIDEIEELRRQAIT